MRLHGGDEEGARFVSPHFSSGTHARATHHGMIVQWYLCVTKWRIFQSSDRPSSYPQISLT
jgi:hypothetical protein